jgi:hypothetical protein
MIYRHDFCILYTEQASLNFVLEWGLRCGQRAFEATAREKIQQPKEMP